ncbi:unnamed protein product [Cylicocyclus nassatus]|uniref:Uncharacterized protein n=1 Tax=Cylicocyclus nassatus TaxID=53992 RepID=A0AA36MGS7_CYLNA|nr:unnamed protein product [Cylicocyclus nassatus]
MVTNPWATTTSQPQTTSSNLYPSGQLVNNDPWAPSTGTNLLGVGNTDRLPPIPSVGPRCEITSLAHVCKEEMYIKNKLTHFANAYTTKVEREVPKSRSFENKDTQNLKIMINSASALMTNKFTAVLNGFLATNTEAPIRCQQRPVPQNNAKISANLSFTVVTNRAATGIARGMP